MTRTETTAGGAARSPAADLLDTMAGLWPSAEVELVAERTRDAGCLAEWALVPGPRSPQQLVPLSSPRAAARVLRRFSAASSVPATSARLLASAATRGTRGAAFGHRVRAHGSAAGSLDEHLAERLGQPVCWSLGIGTARVNRKPVLQVFDERGRGLAFGKVGADDAWHDVEAEATALAQVGAQPWRSMQVPRLLSRTEWNGMLVVLMSPLETSPLQRPSGQWHPPSPPMRELADRYAEPPAPLGDLAWTRRQRETLAGLPDREAVGRTAACLNRLLEVAGDRATVATAWHGDWSPWNVARAGRDRWQVWDWERFEVGVPAGLDRQHWHVNAATRAHGTTRASLRAGLAAAAGPGGDLSRRDPSGWEGTLYLLGIAVRYLWNAERPRGSAILDRTRLIVDELEHRLR